MDEPATLLREALESFRHDEAMERSRRWRGVDDAEREAEVADGHQRLGDVTRIREMLDAATRDGALDAVGAAALRAHLARAAADLSLASARDTLEEAGQAPLPAIRGMTTVASAFDALGDDDAERRNHAERALIGLSERVGAPLAAARIEADGVGLRVFAGGARPPDAGPDAARVRADAGMLLDETEDVAHEARAWLLRPSGSYFELLASLRFDEASALVPRRDRFRRISSGLSALGFEEDLRARVTVAGSHPFPGPRARMLLPRVPRDVRVFTSREERGVASELAGAEVLGRALGHALAASALEVEHRRPLSGSVARGIGVLVAQLLADRVYLRRARAVEGSGADRLGRAAGALLLFLARARAAAALARLEEGKPEELAERGAAALARALGVRVPVAHARLAVVTPAALGPRFRATLCGLAIAWQLRERYDEDWFDNPRVAEPIRAAAARGGLLSIEELADELGATPDLAPRRLCELFG